MIAEQPFLVPIPEASDAPEALPVSVMTTAGLVAAQGSGVALKCLTVVGIGASAGGLEAIESFFKAVPVYSGMAFVVIQHLSPDYKSLMVELLSRKTDIPVQRADDGMEVEANHIYLIPPRKNLTIFHGKLLLADQGQQEGVNLPVDIFLRSLAEDQGERAVAVILSGTGSDGTRGVRAVKEAGGLILVQSEESAKFDGMPRAAISTGLADFILPPEEMPSQLLACLRHPFGSQREARQPVMENETGMTRLFSLLRGKTKVDFTFYKPSTIVRRVERRIAITQSADFDDYVLYAEQNASEVMALYRELLIGVTSFFRDPEVWKVLHDRVLPDLFTQAAGREIRMWVAGCSTGEEAYTLAILCRETMEELNLACDIKIFSTDLDADAITKAGLGVYPESIAADLGPAMITKYFYRHGEKYQVIRSVREMVVFAQHNLVKDPPFTRMDLVTCRNLLIYLQVTLQQRAIEMFAFSLRETRGILLLGSSETLGDMESRFDPVERRARIYRSLGSSSRQPDGEMPLLALRERLGPRPAIGFSATSPTPSREHERLMMRLLECLSASYVPLVVVVNEYLEVLHTLGDTSGIFRLPSGRAVFDISKMVDRELGVPLATGIQKVLRTGEEMAYTNVRLRDGDTSRTLHLRMRPLPGRKHDPSLVAVFFERISAPRQDESRDTAEIDMELETGQRLQDLEQELQFTRENLQATVEELETSNEELQATNEELLASNEELQSTNEELQSTNEELYTVNNEYQSKIIELTEAINDVDNLLTSSRIGILILDEDFTVRRYSPQAAKVFNLQAGDIGRPLFHISHRLGELDALEMATAVQRENKVMEREAHDADGRWYLVRVLPYRIGPQTNAGAVITLFDITDAKRSAEHLELSEKHHRDLHRLLADAERTARMGSWTWDVATDHVFWSENLYALFGRDPVQGAPSFAEHDVLYTPESMARLRQAVKEALEGATPYELRLDAVRADGSIMPCVARCQIEMEMTGGIKRLYGSLQEVAR